MDPEFLLHVLSGGAMITAAVAVARLLLDYLVRGERGGDPQERRLRHDRDAEARLERILQDRLAEADRRLERSDAELRAERVRADALEHDLVRLRQAYDLLEVEYASLLQLAESQRLSR
jgi:hypothetical protein